jgi:glycosyltransferase involved in cell wall biosynthesis
MEKKNERYKVLFVIPSLEAGGAQKVLSVLLNNLSAEKFDITLCVLTATGEFYDSIPQAIAKVNLKLSRVRFAGFKIFKLIKRLNPQLVFVFDVNNLNLVVGLLSFFLPRKIKYITREAVILSSFFEHYRFKWLREILYQLTFRRFDAIVCQSYHMKDDLIKNFRVKHDSISVINNPIDTKFLKKLAVTNKRLLPVNVFNLIAVGRIVYVKGYDLLIQALALVKEERIHLTILGEKTPENPGYRESILRIIEEKNLSEKVSFLGFIDNPHEYVKQSDLLVIASRTEAFSNVAIEANAVGIPVLAFNSPGGMAEIITENTNGWLVENKNVSALAASIDRATSVNFDRTAIAKAAEEKYDVSKIIPAYERVILLTLEGTA